jgi:integrase
MLEDLQLRNLSPETQRSYIEQVARFARHFGRSPALLGPNDIRTYQIYLINEKQLAPSSIIVTTAALRFLYKVTLKKSWSFNEVIPVPKKPQTLPVVLSPEEVLHFLTCVVHAKHRAILTTCYAAGLRVTEAVRLTPSPSIADGWSFALSKGRDSAIATSCSRLGCWTFCGRGGGNSDPAGGSFRVTGQTIRSPVVRSFGHADTRTDDLISANPLLRTP